MEGEIINFIKVWLTVLAALCYCHGIAKLLPSGSLRLLSLLPVLSLFLYLPLLLTSAHLGGTTAFFLAWLLNFKLLLFAYGQPPLSSTPPLSLLKFLALACFPIKLSNSDNPQNQTPPPKSLLSYAVKALLMAVIVKLYDYRELMHPKVILFIYSWHVYFSLEITLAVAEFIGRKMAGIELEPLFNEPYFSTSLQDFWGRRWNLVVSATLQRTVYRPAVRLAAPVVGRKWAPLPAVVGTFLVSALMHELIFYYMGRMRPTGEITLFFVIHGVALAGEILVKKTLPEKWRLPSAVSVPVTVGFVFVTGIWLFFPQFVRCKIDVKAFEEFAAMGDFLKMMWRSLIG